MGNDKIIHVYFSHLIYLIGDVNYLSNTLEWFYVSTRIT